MVRERPLTVIMKVTNDCNLACEYCYADSGSRNPEKMSETTLENSLVKITQHTGPSHEVEFIWHGGEPMLMGIDFYKMATEIRNRLRSEGYKVRYSMQTNGTLFDDDSLDFLVANGFSIGLSLDGPREVDRLTRHFTDGTPSFDSTMDTISGLKKRKKSTGVVTVLSNANIDRLDEMYDFYRSNHIHPKINPLIYSGRSLGKNSLVIRPHEYGKALVKLFDRWINDDTTLDVSPFDAIMGNLMTKETRDCNFSDACQLRFISMAPDGSIYPCGRFNEDSFCYGNINEYKIEDIDEHPLRKSLQNRGYETVSGCTSCDYKKICNAGCMHNAYMKTGNPMGKDYYCASYKILFKHVETVLHKELEKAEVKE